MKVGLFVFIAVLLFSCGDENGSNYVTMDDDGNRAITKEKEEIVKDLLADFKDCRQNSTKNLLDCKYFIAKALCEFYDIDDFEKNGKYVDYHEMHEIILGKFGTWHMIGPATSQKALNKAQDHASNGQATVAISTNDPYGHVAIILPGETSKAPSWNNLKVPNCASFFMIHSLEPFIGKSLAYAWRSPDGIMLYARNQD